MKILAATMLNLAVSSKYQYTLFNEPLSWTQASSACKIYPTATLVRIASKEDREDINQLIQNNSRKQFWIEAFGLWQHSNQQLLNTWVNAVDELRMAGCGSFLGNTFKVEECQIKLPYIC